MQRYKLCIYFMIAWLFVPVCSMQLPIDMPALCPLLNDSTLLQKRLTEVHEVANSNDKLRWSLLCILGIAWSLSSNDECKNVLQNEIESISLPICQHVLNLGDEEIPLHYLIMSLHGAALTGNTVVLRAMLDKDNIKQVILSLIQQVGAIWLLISLLRNNDLYTQILLDAGANKKDALSIINNQLQQLSPIFLTFLNMTLLDHLTEPFPAFIQQFGAIDISVLQQDEQS